MATKRAQAKEGAPANQRPNEPRFFLAFDGGTYSADEESANFKSVKLVLSLQSDDSLPMTQHVEKTMNTDLKTFVEQMLRAILMTLVPVVATAFLTMPINIGGHPGEMPAQTTGQRHMT